MVCWVISDDTKAVALTLAAAAKGGQPSVVLFPANKVFLTGPINMSSAMTLQVEGTVRAKNGNNTADGIAAWYVQAPATFPAAAALER